MCMILIGPSTRKADAQGKARQRSTGGNPEAQHSNSVTKTYDLGIRCNGSAIVLLGSSERMNW